MQFLRDNPEIRDLISKYVKFIRVLLMVQLVRMKDHFL